jgi:hypothetical protein
MRRLSTTLAALAFVVLATEARADDGAEERAQKLFDEGVAAMEAGRFDEACPKLAESMRLQSAGGTLLNLAYCHERTNRLVLAARTYEEAARLAETEGRSSRHAQAMQRHARLLERIPRVVVSPPANRLAEVEVSIDGTAAATTDIEPSEDRRSLVARVDPGTHIIVVRSRVTSRAVTSTIDARDGETSTVVVDERDLAAPPPKTASPNAMPIALRAVPPSAREAPRRGPPTSAIVLGVGAIGAGIAGTVLGVLAANEHAESERLCAGGCTTDAIDAERRADTLAWGSNAAFGTAIVALGVGTAIWLFQR